MSYTFECPRNIGLVTLTVKLTVENNFDLKLHRTLPSTKITKTAFVLSVVKEKVSAIRPMRNAQNRRAKTIDIDMYPNA